MIVNEHMPGLGEAEGGRGHGWASRARGCPTGGGERTQGCPAHSIPWMSPDAPPTPSQIEHDEAPEQRRRPVALLPQARVPGLIQAHERVLGLVRL